MEEEAGKRMDASVGPHTLREEKYLQRVVHAPWRRRVLALWPESF